jgi:CubicO group peptidase (beta-lactamase class C family)
MTRQNAFHINRRQMVVGAIATLAAGPLRAQAPRWREVAEAARGMEQCHALLVVHRGETVLQEAFRGPAMGRAVPIKSVSKSVVAALTGAAIDRGEIGSVEDQLGELAPRLIPSVADPRVADLRVLDLVSLQAGLERTSGANYGGWIGSANWVADALSRPFVANPGTRMLYSTGTTHVLGAVLAEVSGKSLLSLARERLGDPLGIDIPAWTRDPQGRYLGGNEMALSLPAMARFGQMYLDDGMWNGTRVLSADWVRASFEPQTRSPWSGLGYGYGWFVGSFGRDDFALARGYGGQIICVVPRQSLVVVLTSDPTRPARSGGYFGDIMRLMESEVLPAARAAQQDG